MGGPQGVSVSGVDAFELPEWLGVEDVTWTATVNRLEGAPTALASRRTASRASSTPTAVPGTVSVSRPS